MRVREHLNDNDTEVAVAPEAGLAPSRVLVGGVGYRWLGDGSFGLAVTDELALAGVSQGVEVADLGYGALHVALDLADAQPPYDRLILVSAVPRGREPGRLYRRRWDGTLPAADEILARVREATAGVIDLDHLLVVAAQLGALPEDVVVIELEPVVVAGSCELSPAAARLVAEVVELVKTEAVAPAGCPRG
jgi:hydrogenase maturation protease